MNDLMQQAQFLFLATTAFGLSLYGVLFLVEEPEVPRRERPKPAPAEIVYPWCEHDLEEGRQFKLLPGEYAHRAAYWGKSIQVSPGGKYTTEEWSCTYIPLNPVEGKWSQDGGLVVLGSGVGLEGTPRTMRLILDDGLLALHSVDDHGFCNGLLSMTPAELDETAAQSSVER